MIDKIPEIKYRDMFKSKNIDDTHTHSIYEALCEISP